MNCPKCKEELENLQIKGLNILYCKQCKGIYIKFPMLKKMSEMLQTKTEIINPAEMETIKVKEEQRICPDCSKPMDKVYFNGIIVDKCSECNSIWFDNGELAKYFNLFLKKPVEVCDNKTFITTQCNKPVSKDTEYHELEIQSKEKEKPVSSINGFMVLAALIVSALLAIPFALFIPWIIPILSIVGIVMIVGFKILKPQEALALTIFGEYIGTLRGAGFHWVNPLAQSATPLTTISLKAMTLDNGKQKINDELGNPIEVGIIVIWEVADTAKAIFNVDNYKTFISAQSDSALRNIVRMYPYDAPEDSGIVSLRGDSVEISAKWRYAVA